MYKNILPFIFLLVTPLFSWGQAAYTYDSTIAVFEDNRQLKMPWAGGLNSGQYYNIDLNRDGVQDLVVFDRTSSKISTFISGDGVNEYAPEYEILFPENLNAWIVLKDFDCDGIKDLFTSSVFGIKAYKGIVSGEALSWELVADPLNTIGFSGEVNLQVNASDMPAIVDVDEDGDLDILVFNFARGGSIEFHQNMSKEEGAPCGLNFKRVTNKWGNFEECSCGVYAFGTSCADLEGKSSMEPGKILHAGGKSLLLLDYDGDGDKDMIFGDEACNGLAYFENYGTKENASFLTFTPDFPNGEQEPDFPFPAAYYLDVDQDGINELIIAPNSSSNLGNGIDFSHSSWLYENEGTNVLPEFTFEKKDFLQEEMIDIGENAAPVFADFNDDGLLDLAIGGKGAIDATIPNATLTLYLNTGSKASPVFNLTETDFLSVSALDLSYAYPGTADINGDGFSDLYFTGLSGSTNVAAVYYILSEGGLFPSSPTINTLPISISASDKPSLADINNDNFADLVIAKGSGRFEYHEFSGSAQTPAYTLANASFAGFVDKFENRNLIPHLYDIDDDRQFELVISDALGKLYLIEEFFAHTGGLVGADTVSIENASFSLAHSTRLGNQTRIAVANLFGDTLPSIIAGTIQGGIQILRSSDQIKNPGGEVALTFELYPNPTDGLLKILSNKRVEVKIYDTTGRKVWKTFTVNADKEFIYSSLPLSAGVYIVTATAENGKQKSKKLIVL